VLACVRGGLVYVGHTRTSEMPGGDSRVNCVLCRFAGVGGVWGGGGPRGGGVGAGRVRQ